MATSRSSTNTHVRSPAGRACRAGGGTGPKRSARGESDGRARQTRGSTGNRNEADLLVGIVHDLRSPLTSILFLAETLQRGASGPVTEFQHRQLGLIYSAALGLSTLVNDALELACSGTRLVDDEAMPLSVTELLESVRAIVRPMAEEKGLDVRLLKVEPDARLGHAVALSRALLNLTTNAIKFTEHGFVEITALARGPATVEFAVRDFGPGIDPTALAHLYRPLRPSVKPGGLRFSSTGLGLAISRRLVAAMGSELQLETRPGWGTRFFFEVELATLEDVEDADASAGGDAVSRRVTAPRRLVPA